MAKKYKYTKTFTLPNGKRKYVYGDTLEEVDRKLTEAKLLVGAGIDISQSLTFGEWALQWYTVFKKGRVGPSREAGIRSALNNHILPVITGVELRKLTPMHCQAVLNQMAVSDKSKSTQDLVRVTLKDCLEAAVENNLIVRNPCNRQVRSSGRETDPKTALTPDQIQTMFDALKGKRLEPMAAIQIHTGLRRGELIALQWDCVNLPDRELTVRRTLVMTGEIEDHAKTASGIRTIPLDDVAMVWLRRLSLQRCGPFVFHDSKGNYIQSSTIVARWIALSKAVGFKVTSHTMRHTAITSWFDAGLDIKEVQYLAGHSSADTTLGIYTHYLKDKRFGETKAKVLGLDKKEEAPQQDAASS